MTDTSVFLTQEEVAKLLRISPRTLERRRCTGGGPKFVKAGRRVLYRLEDVENWATARTFTSTSHAEAAA